MNNQIEFYMSNSITERELISALDRILPDFRGRFGSFEEYEPEGAKAGILFTGFPEGSFLLVDIFFPGPTEHSDESRICELLSQELGAAIVHSEKAPNATADNPFLWLLCEGGRSYYVLEDRRRDYDGLVLDLTTKRPI